MSIWTKLEDELPKILPPDPRQAINGTALLKELQSKAPQIFDGVSVASIRQTISALAQTPTSCIVRLQDSHGYYLRGREEKLEFSQNLEEPMLEETGLKTKPEEKFRALFMRYKSFEGSYPVYIDHLSASKHPQGKNKWKFPDVVCLDWDKGLEMAEKFSFDKELLGVKKGLGEQPFKLTSVELKTEITLINARESFFQCLSNSRWAHRAILAIATPVKDSLAADELRRLGTSYGVTVLQFDVNNQLSDLARNSDFFLNVSDEDFEAYKMQETIIATGKERDTLDWEQIYDLRQQSSVFGDIIKWISHCLDKAKPYSMKRYLELSKIEAGQ